MEKLSFTIEIYRYIVAYKTQKIAKKSHHF